MIRINSSNIYGSFVRKFGVLLSSLCAIHCLLVPVFVTLLPVFGHYIKFNFWTELVIYASILIFGGGLMLADYKHHKIKIPLILFLFGFVITVGSHFSSIIWLSNLLITFGGISLAIAQMANIKLHKKVNHKVSSTQ